MLKTPEQYKESLRRMRANIYKLGAKIEDVTTHPTTKRCVEGHAKIYALAHNPEFADAFTTVSNLTGEKISRYLSIIESAEDMIANCKLKRLMFNLTGTCTGGRCVGWNAINTMYGVTLEIDKEFETNYHEKFKNWLIYAQHNDLAVAGAMTDPKGDRSLSPAEQYDLDLNLRITNVSEDGITVRGAKVMIAGVCASNEIFVLPGSSYDEKNKDFAVSFAIPRDIENLTIVEARHPGDDRELYNQDTWDIPLYAGGITQAYLFFEDVFVPNDRVFMCKEFKFTKDVISIFTSLYRAAIGSCVAGQGDVMIGASVNLARINGLSEKVFREKLVKMCINNETTFGLGIAASVLGRKHPSGIWIPNPLLANVCKVHTANLPYETKQLAQDIGGGIAETGCMPSYKDFIDSKYKQMIQKYLKAKSSAEDRFKTARLIEWLTIGAGVPGCMHGGGSPEVAKLFIYANLNIEKYVELAKKLI